MNWWWCAGGGRNGSSLSDRYTAKAVTTPAPRPTHIADSTSGLSSLSFPPSTQVLDPLASRRLWSHPRAPRSLLVARHGDLSLRRSPSPRQPPLPLPSSSRPPGRRGGRRWRGMRGGGGDDVAVVDDHSRYDNTRGGRFVEQAAGTSLPLAGGIAMISPHPSARCSVEEREVEACTC